MEGKEVRFGIVNSALWATVTTDTSAAPSMRCTIASPRWAVWSRWSTCRSARSIFGGVGSGLYGMMVMALLSVFIAGLMVGRTPEYLGKKIEAREMKLAMLYHPDLPGRHTAAGRCRGGHQGRIGGNLQSWSPWFFADSLCVFTEARANNGSAFGGLSANTPFYNFTLGFVMLFGRFMMKIPVLALAGSLAAKKSRAVKCRNLSDRWDRSS